MLYGVKDLRIEDVEVPTVGSREVLVKVGAATTCGTDLKIFQRGYVEKVIKLPTIFGHEWAGEVVEVGKELEWPEKGIRFRSGNSAPCLHCAMCQRGKHNLCENMIWLWGAYAEYIKVPARMVLVNTQEIPPHVSFEEAAITEPLACVLHGVEEDRKSTRLNSSHGYISYAVFCLKKTTTHRRRAVSVARSLHALCA